ncbi:MAG: HD domain-containing protein, partial [Candidatus Omnitrophica bacterium]|nr:HD domain-containing protein [Candidatus Omnitrophota bacterium]
MFRISDILKKQKDESKTIQEDVKDTRKEISGNLSPLIDKEKQEVNHTEAIQLYNEAYSKAKQFHSVNLQERPNLIPEIKNLAERIIKSLETGNEELLKLCFLDYPKPEDYLQYHVINVCIISVYMGISLSYEHTSLIELGTAAFIHDNALTEYTDIINRPKVLDRSEFDKIKVHTEESFEAIKKSARDIGHDALEAVRQEHERLDGSGYPIGIKGAQVNRFSQIIGLADVYEALIHNRPHRGKLTPLEALKTILNQRSAFEPEMIKLLVDKI